MSEDDGKKVMQLDLFSGSAYLIFTLVKRIATLDSLGLAGLPPEMKTSIMSLLPNRSFLFAVVLTCNSFNEMLRI